MNAGMKMLMLTNARSGDAARSNMEMRGGSGGRNNGGYSRMESGGSMNWDAEDRFRDDRGREHYDNGRYAPQNTFGSSGDTYSNRSTRSSMDSYSPSMYDSGEDRPRQRIGFALEPSSHDREYRQDAGIPGMGDEMSHRTSSMMMGRASGHSGKLTKDMAEEWMSGIQNEDGSKGPHWTLEQTKQVMAQKGVQADPLSFWAVLNSMYADYCKVFKKYNVGDKLDFYVDMAKAFIDDKDAGSGKVAAYFENIVRH